MPIYSKLDLAIAYLQQACVLYLAGSHPAVVIHLAGAAEDLFGGLLRSAGQESLGDLMLDLARKLNPERKVDFAHIANVMLGLRASIKHANRPDETSVIIEDVDVHRWLAGALVNAISIGVDPSDEMLSVFVLMNENRGV